LPPALRISAPRIRLGSFIVGDPAGAQQVDDVKAAPLGRAQGDAFFFHAPPASGERRTADGG
jgi:hypothetical protein